MKLQFTKMQALGNDCIVIDCRENTLKRLPYLSRKLCDRRFGIGADQVLLLFHSKKADFRMRIFNADGSEVEMCGNGIRCLGKYIWDDVLGNDKNIFAEKYRSSINRLAIETLAGIIYIQKSGNLFKVDMGEPIFEPEKIPVKINSKLKTQNSKLIINYPLQIKNKKFKITCVSMGNPHAVIIVKDVQSVPVDYLGPLIENNNLFPNRINVEFIEILNQSNIKMRVWERGVGETMACGTGASAAAVASILLGLTARKVTVHLPGGKLLIQWATQNNHVYMTGPAVKVYEGVIHI
jgi:diaminopimelate epimerase